MPVGWEHDPRLAPIEIIYQQVNRCLEERATGQGATEAIAGLMALVEPIKDESFRDDMRAFRDEDSGDRVIWGTIEAIIRLLHRSNLWPTSRHIEEGKEFLQGSG